MAPPPAPSAPPAFPRGSYATYKRATSFFLHWLLRADDNGVVGRGEVPSASSPLHVYDRIVRAVTREPTALSTALLRELPRALHACECAITLRARVAAFFGDAADAGHAHFLDRMSSWRTALTDALLPLTKASSTEPSRSKERKEKQTDFSNYYDVLDLPEDYFGDEDQGEEDLPERQAGCRTPRSTRERKNSADDTFADDFQTELACMLMELEELSEAVYAAFFDVKTERKTLLEAAVVSKVAIDCAVSVIASFQLHNPFVVNAMVLSVLMSAYTHTELLDAVKSGWKPSKEARYAYCRGTISVDFIGISHALSEFNKLWVGRNCERFQGRNPMFDRVYDEETSQEWVVPDLSDMTNFFMSCLPRLFNYLEDIRKIRSTILNDSLEMQLLDAFEHFRRTGEITIHLVFICACWVRSVAALQGNKDLRRSVSASIMHMYDVRERLMVSTTDNKTNTSILNKIEMSTLIVPLMRTNPVLAGYVMLDHQLRFLQLGNDKLLVVPFRALSHIYSALRAVRLLDQIPFLEDTIGVYEASLFTPSRAAASHGAFAESFLASQTLLLASICVRHGKETSSKPVNASSFIEKARLINLSHVVGLIKNRDFSFLPAQASSSWTSLLSAVSITCREELFDSRLLSRDALRLCDDVPKVCLALCDALGRRSDYDRMACTSTSVLALQNAIVFPLLPMLDALHRDDVATLSLDHVDGLPGEALFEATKSGSASSRLAFCRRAASIFKHHFDRPAWVERNYFTIASFPAWVSVQYSSSVCGKAVEPKSSVVMSEFNSLLAMLRTSQGPLRGQKLERFKQRVISMPMVTAMVTPDPTIELCTLLHHAAAGPARDNQLVEWLIQMGALESQATCFRDKRRNALAIHCAAKRGFRKIVEHIVEAGNFRDIDTMTHDTKESLVAFAVKSDNLQLWGYLCLFGADTTGVDASGRDIWELTSNPHLWKEVKKAENDRKREQETSSGGSNQSKPASITNENEALSLDKDTLTASPHESVPEAETATKSKRKRKKKGKKSKEACTLAAGAPAGHGRVKHGQDELRKIELVSAAFKKLLR